ncbi:hypothetical protein AAFN46_02885 [Pseudomonas sp. CAU 1711]|uniref:hypothetical protein n=1 Tax=Pseudomonas sp. CAU 1711 TaxID=3140356 RepID=UPI003261C18F
MRICTYSVERLLTNASGFFFARDQHLFLVSSRHVLMDEPSRHFPERLEIEVHSDPNDLGCSCIFLYRCIVMARSCGAKGWTRLVPSMWH